MEEKIDWSLSENLREMMTVVPKAFNGIKVEDIDLYRDRLVQFIEKNEERLLKEYKVESERIKKAEQYKQQKQQELQNLIDGVVEIKYIPRASEKCYGIKYGRE